MIYINEVSMIMLLDNLNIKLNGTNSTSLDGIQALNSTEHKVKLMIKINTQETE